MQPIDPSIQKAIKQAAPALKRLALDIHRHPETGYKEVRAARRQTVLLRQWGFKVTAPFAGLPTAYKAEVGTGRPVFAILAEYDALAQLGHGCGHNLIAAAALGAARGLAAAMRAENLSGTLAVIGTPAEETLGGKVVMARAGAFRGLDAVMMAHPSWRTTPDTGSSAVTRFTVTFHGKAAHAAASPELGRNALDAVTLLFQGVNAWRQHLPETSRVHGIITAGGVAPNIVPDTAACFFYLRSRDDGVLKKMRRFFINIARGAALMTGTRTEIQESDCPYQARKPNRALNDAFMQYAAAAGLNPITPERPGRASSDFGNVSRLAPGAHVYFGIARQTIAGHSTEMRAAAGSAYGLEQMLRAAAAMAATGRRFFADAAFRKEVARDFRRPG